MAPAVLKGVLVDGLTLGQLYSRRTDVALPAYRYRFRQALRRWVARPSPQAIPRGPLVLLADGLWFEFEGIPWVLYLRALKPRRGRHATFLDPVLLPGREGANRWQQAIEAIPRAVRKRDRAMVVDDLPGMQKIAAQQQWALQLCHFHLLLKVQARRGRVRYRLRGGAVREEIQQLVRSALELPDGRQLNAVVQRLQRLARRKRHGAHPGHSPRVSQDDVLPHVPSASGARAASDDQLGRIDVSIAARDVPQQSRGLESKLPPVLGHGFYPSAANHCLQWPSHQQKILIHPHFESSS